GAKRESGASRQPCALPKSGRAALLAGLAGGVAGVARGLLRGQERGVGLGLGRGLGQDRGAALGLLGELERGLLGQRGLAGGLLGGAGGLQGGLLGGGAGLGLPAGGPALGLTGLARALGGVAGGLALGRGRIGGLGAELVQSGLLRFGRRAHAVAEIGALEAHGRLSQREGAGSAAPGARVQANNPAGGAAVVPRRVPRAPERTLRA